MSNNSDVWILEKPSLCRRYILSKKMNMASCQHRHSTDVRSDDKRLVIYDHNVQEDEGYGRLECSCWFSRVGASGAWSSNECGDDA